MKRTTIVLTILALSAGAYFAWRKAPASDASTSIQSANTAVPTGQTAATPSTAAAVATSSPAAASATIAATGRAPANQPDRRPWDSQFIASFRQTATNSPVRFELTGGLIAVGTLRYSERRDGEVIYISGSLTEPEAGRFFFQKQTMPGKQGDFAGVVEFPASKTAYRIEPSGPGGSSELVKRRLEEVICLAMPAVDEKQLAAGDPEQIPPLDPQDVGGYVPEYQDGIISLQSLPGAIGVLYIDYRGGYTPTWGGITYDKPNVSNATIKDVWKRVAEDYMPFNINVTTDIRIYQAAPENSRQRCVVTPTTTAAPGAGGVAYMNNWNSTGDTPCWAFYSSGKNAAEVISHEVGHTLQLGHDGRTTPVEGYYGGQGSGAVGWAPIMGVGYYQPVAQWSKGEYANANNTEDDLAMIVGNNNNVDYRADDTGATLATSRYLDMYSGNIAFGEGVIETTGDTDAFRFTTTGGTMSLYAVPVGDWADLAISATLCDSANTVIASNNPQTLLSASIVTNLTAGTYTFRVTGAGRNDPVTNGFSSYASLGYYTVTGTVVGAIQPTRLSVVENATNGTIVGTVPATNLGVDTLVYTITSGNISNAFALDSNGVLTVANSAALDYETLASKTQFPVQYEMFVNITNTVNLAMTELNRRLVVAILDVNEPPSGTGFTNTIFAGTQIGTYLGTVVGKDPDNYAILNYSLTAGNSNNVFAIGLLTGKLTVASNIPNAMTGTYDLTVQVLDTATNGTTALANVRIVVVTNNTPFLPGSISYALYDGFSSTATISDLTNNARFPRDPSSEKQMASFAGDTDRADSYGSVMRGYLIPPVSGSYTFYIASDDTAELWISSGTNTASLARIAYNTSYTSPEQWTKYSSQKSSARSLVAGQGYYIEARHKEGTGGDNLAVGWKGPANNNLTNVIPGTCLAPYKLNYIPHPVGFTANARRNLLPGSRIGQVVVNDVNSTDTNTFAITAGNSEGIFAVDSQGWIVVSNATTLSSTPTTSFTLTVQATDSGSPALSGTATVALTLVAADVISVTQIQREMFYNIGSGTAVTNLTTNAKYPGKPDALVALSDFSTAANVADNYGSRVRCFVIPPTNGNYRFFIASDDNSQLSFSRTTNASSATVIATVANYTTQNTWNQYASQVSGLQAGLIGGQRYYLEALHKEGGGGDHLGVAWAGPGIVDSNGVLSTNIIAAAFMAPVNLNYAPQFTNRSFTLASNAANGTVLGTLNASDGPLDTVTFQILSGNTGNSLAVEPATGILRLADNSAIAGGLVDVLSLSVVARDSGYGGLYPLCSATSTVTVTIQKLPPVPQNFSALAWGSNLVALSWSPVTNSTGWVLSRNGTNIATSTGTNYLDFGVSPSGTYCYALAVTNLLGWTWTATNCVTTPSDGGALVWDANRSVTGVQDGTGTWGTSALNWWNGSSSVGWTKPGRAVIGGPTTTNCLITITNSVAVNGVVFNTTGGGFYTLAASGGTLTLNTNALFTANGAGIINAPIAGGGMTKDGTNTLTFNGANTYSGGTTIIAGTLKAGGTSGSFGYGQVSIAKDTVCEWNVASASRVISSVNSYAGEGLFLKSGIYNLQFQGANASTFSGTVRITGGLLILDTSTGFLNGSPNLDLFGGDLVLGNAFDNGTASFANVTGSGQIRVDWGSTIATRTVVFNQSSNTTYAGTLGYSAGQPRVLNVVKSGEATLTLTGTSTNLGSVTVSNGTLVVNGSIGTNAVYVLTNTTLCGTGSISGEVSVSGTVSPGPGVGTLSTCDETWNSGGTYLCEIAGTNSDAADQLVISGDLLLQATPESPFTIKLVSLTSTNTPGPLGAFESTASYSWPIATVSGILPGLDTNSLVLDTNGFANDLAGGSLRLASSSNALLLVFTPYSAPTSIPKIGGISVLPNQTVLLSATCSPGQICTLLYTTNLLAPVLWTPMATNAADAFGAVSFTDSNTNQDEQRYYMILSP